MKKLFASLAFMAIATGVSFGQAISTNGGSIQGTITDPTGASVPNATVTISSPETGYSKTITTDGSGFYAVGPLVPGNYVITVSAGNFQKLATKTVVHTGTVTPGSEKLTVGSNAETVEVNAGTLQVNTDQIGVAGIITKDQVDTLPINGRNVLDVAQIEPGVILQSGGTFDPTKVGYTGVSVGGVSSRTTRILLDGQDITDETVGTTLYNVPTGAVAEVQLNRSTQDVSGEVTSTGQLLLATNSGTNKFHGNLFYNFQDANAGFAKVLGKFEPFQRNQFGGYIGGPIIKDKLFFYGGGERLKQDEKDVAQSATKFQAILNQFPYTPAPFRDNFGFARLDYNAPKGIHAFARGIYSQNADSALYNSRGPYMIYKNRDVVRGIVGGVDFTTAKFTHSVRVGYEKFHNIMGDGTASLGSSIYDPFSPNGPTGGLTLYDSTDGFYAGPNYLAPQQTFQSDKQVRYDGTWTKGAHNVKFGAELNRISNGGFANFYNYGLVLFSPATALRTCSSAPPFGGLVGTACPGDPTNGYTVSDFLIGNGNGYSTEYPGFGLPNGGIQSWRIAAYVADTWKITPSLTINAGLRWSVDTNRANQDTPSPRCGDVSSDIAFTGCGPTSNPNAYLFDQWRPGLGGSPSQPWANFGPQAGFVFSPGSHKLSIRGGAGIYYEGSVFNNLQNARSSLLKGAGNFFTSADTCGGTFPGTKLASDPTATALAATICGGGSIASVSNAMASLKQLYQNASTTGSGVVNFIGSSGGTDLDIGGASSPLYAHPYVSPYSIQMNGGVQEEIKKGLLLSVDFVHSATLKVPLSPDVNRQGAANTFNLANTQANLSAMSTAYSCGGGHTSADVACIISKGAGHNTFSSWGFDSPNSYYYSGLPNTQAVYNGVAGTSFQGNNPNVGEGSFILPIGRSAYDALQITLQQQKVHPLPGILKSNLQIAYSLSRAVSNVSGSNSDQFFAGAAAADNDNPNAYIGRNSLDHSNMLTMGGSLDVKYGLRIGMIGHFYSAAATTLALPTGSTSNRGEIFRTDITGDGTVGDIIPGTVPGAYMHSVRPTNLNSVISNFNAAYAGKVTPAGQQLLNSGMFTQAQLTAIGDVIQPLALAPNTPMYNSAARTFDVNAGYPIRFFSKYHEGLVITPAVNMYNVFNMSNFGRYTGLANTTTAGGAVNYNVSSYINGPNNPTVYNALRTARQSGTFDQGGPRTTEFQLRIDF